MSKCFQNGFTLKVCNRYELHLSHGVHFCENITIMCHFSTLDGEGELTIEASRVVYNCYFGFTLLKEDLQIYSADLLLLMIYLDLFNNGLSAIG